MIPLIIIAGPTATGKSERAIHLAKRLNSEIISADSMQVYCYFDIGTAKPTINNRKTIPHHLIDIINPDEEYSAGKFKKDAEKIINKIHTKEKIPIVSGGTGLYINTIARGLSMAAPSDPELRKNLRESLKKEGSRAMHSELLKVDPDAAKKINPADKFRIERALEVYYLTGKPMSSLQSSEKHKTNQYDVLYIILNLDRSLLYQRINERVDRMIEKGLVDEVSSIISRGYSGQLKPFQSIGYKEIIQYLSNELTLEEAVKKIKKETRNFAKRQLTWFKKVPSPEWIKVDFKKPEMTDEAIYAAVQKHFNF
tara:strand:- start:14231 stop:15163 length:933 start_codon:yes stop_codon:yes gene_type:complete